jgi:Asp-tRNA(Asn)/Glu-tRNA(Gln) amidotransferase A subunit family amidase
MEVARSTSHPSPAPATRDPPSAVRRALNAIGEMDSAIRAWTHVTQPPETGLRPSGPLAGVPFGVKDNIDVAGMPTRCGSAASDSTPARVDASCVALLRRAGAVPLGKTVTTEFAHETPGPTRNPAALDHTPGGSSSGSAAAVAAGMVPFAIGTQTGGSLIRPAAYCGVVGFKPTFGVVSRGGMAVNCESLDVVGWYGANTRIVDEVARALLSPASHARAQPSLQKLRVAVLRGNPGHRLEEAAAAALANAGAALATHGADVDDTFSFSEAPRLLDAHAVLMRHELSRTLLPLLGTSRHLLSRALRETIARGLTTTADAYLDALALQSRQRLQWSMWFGRCDLVLTSSALGPAPRGLEDTGPAAFNKGWSVLGWPCLHLPTTVSAEGLPLGVLLVGPPGSDLDLLAWGRAIHPLVDRRAMNRSTSTRKPA